MFHMKQKKDKGTARYGVKNRGSEMHHLNKTRRELEGVFHVKHSRGEKKDEMKWRIEKKVWFKTRKS